MILLADSLNPEFYGMLGTEPVELTHFLLMSLAKHLPLIKIPLKNFGVSNPATDQLYVRPLSKD